MKPHHDPRFHVYVEPAPSAALRIEDCRAPADEPCHCPKLPCTSICVVSSKIRPEHLRYHLWREAETPRERRERQAVRVLEALGAAVVLGTVVWTVMTLWQLLG
jgi:hypothetical protein